MKPVRSYFFLAALMVFLSAAVCPALDPNWTKTDFDSITLSNISSQNQTSVGNSTITIYTEVNIHIIADNTAASQLTHQRGEAKEDTLVTEYRLTFDGDGSSATGAADTGYVQYNSFLSEPVTVTHFGSDNYVDVTLWVRAGNRTGNVANRGIYNATQTLTITWSD
jgi:hypothetical protein